jgi:hypothetical protein
VCAVVAVCCAVQASLLRAFATRLWTSFGVGCASAR